MEVEVLPGGQSKDRMPMLETQRVVRVLNYWSSLGQTNHSEYVSFPCLTCFFFVSRLNYPLYLYMADELDKRGKRCLGAGRFIKPCWWMASPANVRPKLHLHFFPTSPCFLWATLSISFPLFVSFFYPLFLFTRNEWRPSRDHFFHYEVEGKRCVNSTDDGMLDRIRSLGHLH